MEDVNHLKAESRRESGFCLLNMFLFIFDFCLFMFDFCLSIFGILLHKGLLIWGYDCYIGYR